MFWSHNLFIVLAATGDLLGATQSKEYAGPEWYVDIWLTVVWLVYLAVFLGTILHRRERHIHVANWFYLAFIVTVAMLHVVNNLSVPVSIWRSTSVQIFAAVQDAMTQWWYGHNAVGFFLTAGFLGMMHYFVPKQAGRPISGYKLSIIHFWALIFLYIWAGPHHLHYTALPDRAATLGMVFSALYFLTPRLWGRTEMHSVAAINLHFWLATLEIVLYAASMGLGHHGGPDVARGRRQRLPRQRLRRRRVRQVPDVRGPRPGRRPLPRGRARHGLEHVADNPRARGAPRPRSHPRGVKEMTKGPRSPDYDPTDDPEIVTTGAALREGDIPNELPPETKRITFHQRLERNATLLLAASFAVVTVGGAVEIAPLFWLENTIEEVEGMRPYSPLELAGRDIYIREGCYTCLSQMIRPMRDEVERYGHYSLAAESMYDHPHQWGSKRTGPDLARVGGRYSDEWHVDHLMDPQSVVPESVMPKYAFLTDRRVEATHIGELVETHAMVGVPELSGPREDPRPDGGPLDPPSDLSVKFALARRGDALAEYETTLDRDTDRAGAPLEDHYGLTPGGCASACFPTPRRFDRRQSYRGGNLSTQRAGFARMRTKLGEYHGFATRPRIARAGQTYSAAIGGRVSAGIGLL